MCVIQMFTERRSITEYENHYKDIFWEFHWKLKGADELEQCKHMQLISATVLTTDKPRRKFYIIRQMESKERGSEECFWLDDIYL